MSCDAIDRKDIAASSCDASLSQIGDAASIRYAVPMDRVDINKLHAITHSADKTGEYANMDNPYRDVTKKYDPKAEATIAEVKKKYAIS
jgi:hypothetical protein